MSAIQKLIERVRARGASSDLLEMNEQAAAELEQLTALADEGEESEKLRHEVKTLTADSAAKDTMIVEVNKLIEKWKGEMRDNEPEKDIVKEASRLSYIVTLELCIDELAAALSVSRETLKADE